MKWQAVVFDLDDTLYPEHDYVFSGFRAVAAWMAARTDIPAQQGAAELCQFFADGIRGSTFNHWCQAHQWDEALIPQLVQIYRDHVPQLQPFPEIVSLLEALRPLCRLGIISDGYLTVQQRKFDALQLASAFDVVIFSDAWGRENWKPSEKPYREALSRLQTDPKRTIYVGDNPLKDFAGARACGWQTIWLRQPTGEYARHEPPTPDFAPHVIVSRIPDLAAYLLPSTAQAYS